MRVQLGLSVKSL